MAHGQFLDGVDARALGNGDMEIVVRFTTQFQYLRHSPKEAGKVLRVYMRQTGVVGMGQGAQQPETIRPPRVGRLLTFTVTFPEPGNSLLVAFERPAHFVIHPGADGRSLRIVVSPASGG